MQVLELFDRTHINHFFILVKLIDDISMSVMFVKYIYITAFFMPALEYDFFLPDTIQVSDEGLLTYR